MTHCGSCRPNSALAGLLALINFLNDVLRRHEERGFDDRDTRVDYLTLVIDVRMTAIFRPIGPIKTTRLMLILAMLKAGTLPDLFCYIQTF